MIFPDTLTFLSDTVSVKTGQVLKLGPKRIQEFAAVNQMSSRISGGGKK